MAPFRSVWCHCFMYSGTSWFLLLLISTTSTTRPGMGGDVGWCIYIFVWGKKNTNNHEVPAHNDTWRHLFRYEATSAGVMSLFSVLRFFVIFAASYLNHHTTGDGWWRGLVHICFCLKNKTQKITKYWSTEIRGVIYFGMAPYRSAWCHCFLYSGTSWFLLLLISTTTRPEMGGDVGWYIYVFVWKINTKNDEVPEYRKQWHHLFRYDAISVGVIYVFLRKRKIPQTAEYRSTETSGIIPTSVWHFFFYLSLKIFLSKAILKAYNKNTDQHNGRLGVHHGPRWRAGSWLADVFIAATSNTLIACGSSSSCWAPKIVTQI